MLWAPVVDSVPIPFLTRLLGQRRSWMLIGQVGIATDHQCSCHSLDLQIYLF
ncbi:MAG: hypothetical protein ACNYPE_00075 [Candidatus Azotimanducaceae bacterium WSBS_2022_MAG_OTU7]